LKKKVSVIIPVYNNSFYVLDAIKSVLDQDYENIEIIIIDDGSTDDSYLKIESEYGSRVKIIRIENSGVSSARNVGINASSGCYIAFLDSDDFWELDKLSKQVDSIERSKEYGLSYTGRYIIDVNNKIVNGSAGGYTGFVLNKILVRNFVCLSSVLIRKECFLKCGLFDTTLKVSEDYDLWIKIASRYKFVYLDERLVYYRITPGSLTKDVSRMIVNAHCVFVKNTLDVDLSSKVNFLTYVFFYSDTFKTTGHYFYDKKNFKVAMHFFGLSVLLWPIRMESVVMLIRSSFKRYLVSMSFVKKR